LSPKARKKSKPTAQPSSYIEPKRKPTTREKTIKTGAILIVLALVLSLLAGALSFSPTTPAIAAESQSVQIYAVDSGPVDTDGDGLENNVDPDVDGDGIVNGEDPDIDGDGIENFDDADPVDTNDIDSNAPEKPSRPEAPVEILTGESSWLWVALLVGILSLIPLWILGKRRKKRT
jgi:LPXTG-motif cell wall-anchored protein